MTRDWQPRARPVGLTLGGLVLIGAVLRLRNLGVAPLNFDESFTAMVGRLPLGTALGFLRAHDSHPPLDYLLQLPLARAGVSSFWFRLPSALCSIGALALFSWWMRERGRVGLFATAAFAISAFQLHYGREARMYGLMELIGVASAIVAERWLREPATRKCVVIGALTFVGLMTHVSMVLLAVGLVVLAGVRRDAPAWRWRAAIALGTAGWGALWGAAFLVQARGGHSSWIPHTTPARFVDTISALVTTRPGVSVVVVAAIVVGAIVCRRRDPTLAAVLMCCFVVPVSLAGLFGLRAPVLLDRTLAVVSWGPLLALGYLLDALSRRTRSLGALAVIVTGVAMLAAVPQALALPGATAALTEIERVARPGDVVAIEPPAKGVELDWTLAVRSDDGPVRAVGLADFHDAVALALTSRPPSGRIWLMQYKSEKIDLRHYRLCASTWHHGPNRMLCIRHDFGLNFSPSSSPSITAIYAATTPSRNVAEKK